MYTWTIMSLGTYAVAGGGVEVIVDLLSQGGVAVARRTEDAVWGRTKRSEVKKILKIADRHFEELVGLWEEIHGSADSRR